MSAEIPMIPSRRRLLAALIGLAATTVLGGCEPRTAGTGQTARRFSRLTLDPAAARHIGDAYLRARPAERDVESLLQGLESALAEGDDKRLPEDAGRLAERLDRRVREEYRRGELVRVDDWLLSISEVRCYAVIALT